MLTKDSCNNWQLISLTAYGFNGQKNRTSLGEMIIVKKSVSHIYTYYTFSPNLCTFTAWVRIPAWSCEEVASDLGLGGSFRRVVSSTTYNWLVTN